jgi:vesicle-associated membrane protein 4
MWWKDIEMRLSVILGIIVLIVVIIVPAGMWYSLKRRENRPDDY